MRIEIISGSPREKSVTHRLALYLYKFLSAETEHEIGIIDLRENVLPFVQTVITPKTELPNEQKELVSRMMNADAYIIVTPEYNGSYSPALQNLFDHFPKRYHKPFGLVTGSPGAFGGMRAAMQLQQLVLALFGIPSPYMLIVPQLDKKFDAEGNLIEPSFQKSVDDFVTEFLWLAEHLVPEKIVA